MPKCPNCGLETLRTEDWACQCCGYPLLSSAYKKIPKTYKQLKQEEPYKAKPTPESKLEPEPVLESQREPLTEPELESEPEPVLESQREPVTEPEREVEPILKPELESEPVTMELTVEELLSAYAADGVAADIKFTNNLLRIAGVVAMIDVKDKFDTHCIRLTDAERNLSRSVRCMFDKKHAPALQQLEIGQTVTVEGIYNGSLIAIRMVDCVLV